MSSRRSSRSSHPNNGIWNDTRIGIADDQVSNLLSKLQHLIPELRHRNLDEVSASKLLQETCNYIRSLHREMDDLSDRLVRILGSSDEADSDQAAAIIRSLLSQ